MKIAGLFGHLILSSRHTRVALASVCLTLALLLPGWSSRAQVTDALTTIFTFPQGSPAPDGEEVNGIIQGSDGYLYGTALAGGEHDDGTAFKLTTSGNLEFVYSFVPDSDYVSLDGAGPEALIEGIDGNYYGATASAGPYGDGTIFQLTAGGARTNVHLFDQASGGKSSLIEDSQGNFYGTSVGGGASSSGTVFQVTPSGTENILYSFLNNNSDGTEPNGLLLESNGNFYGTTAHGGVNGNGTIFELTPSGNGAVFSEAILHPFSATGSNSANGDGALPAGGLIQDSQGNFYGTAELGGANGAGTIFKYSSTNGFQVLHSFGGTGFNGFANPAVPIGALTFGMDGNIYGTTYGGGNGYGTIFRITPAGSAFTVLHNFDPAAGEGSVPESALFQGSDGNFYGTTQNEGTGGATGGTIFQFNPNGAVTPGSLQFTVAAVTVDEAAGSVTVSVSRTVGNVGPVAITCSTSDGTAVAGVDYTGSSAILPWGDHDASSKTFTIPLTDTGLSDGIIKNFSVVLSSPGGGAIQGMPSVQTVTITQQPAVALTSPPGAVTVVSGTTVPLTASVTDPAGILTQVQFFLDSTLLSASAAPGPYIASATAPAPGNHTLEAVATDSLGRQSTSSIPLTVVAATASAPGPSIQLLSAGNGLTLAANSMLTLDVSAFAGSASDPLASVSFYANGVLFASFDGSGNQITSLGGQVRGGLVRRDAASGESVYEAIFPLSNVNEQINAIATAATKLGLTALSAPVTVKSVAGSAGQAPVVSIGVTDKSTVTVNSALTAPVTVTGTNGQPITNVAYYVNNVAVNGSAQAPYGFTFVPPAAGNYTLSATATDGSQLSAVTDVRVQAVPSKVSVVLKGGASINESGGQGKFFIKLAGSALSADLKVKYQIKGTAVNGTDYAGIPKKAVIPAGASRVKIKIAPIDEGITGGGTRSVTIKLLPSPTGAYLLAPPHQATIQILDNG